MILIGWAFASFISTLFGGILALKYRNYAHIMLAFTAGVLISLSGFHLIPEVLEISQEGGYGWEIPLVAVALGYIGFQIFHHLLHRHHDHSTGKRPAVGIASALALASHSFLDGVAIGAAFQVNTQVGILVAIAVIAHDFADGLNAVSIMLAYKNSLQRAAVLLGVVALAPVLGVVSTQLIEIPEVLLLWYLGGFTGFILYLLGKDILPHVIEKGRPVVSGSLILLGIVFIYSVTGVLHGLE
jgi:zinc transporter ZupT